jgi:hypothetical protein
MNLIQLIVPWEQREKGQNLKEYTSNAPVVHLVVIVAICEEAFRRSVPSSRYIFCERWLGVDTSTRTEICELDLVIFDQYIFPMMKIDETRRISLRFYISMKNPILVHMIYTLEDLVHQEFDPSLGEVVSASFYGFIHVHVHQLEY